MEVEDENQLAALGNDHLVTLVLHELQVAVTQPVTGCYNGLRGNAGLTF